MDDTQLEESLVWGADGCLAEPALHALADGELEILPQAARDHAHGCSACSERIAQIAMFSLEVEHALALQRTASPLPAAPLPAASIHRQLPIVPIALSLLVAFASKLPVLRELDPGALGRSAANLLHLFVPLTLKLLALLGHSRLGSALMFCSAAFLLAASALLARSSWGQAASIRNSGGRS